MPDSDRFERRLWGKGLRKAYRLACGADEVNELILLLYNAKNELVRKGLDCPVIDEISIAVYGAVNRPLFAPEENFRWLSQRLDDLSASQLDSHGTRLATKAAKAVCTETMFNGSSATLEQIKLRVRQRFTAELLDDQFFSRVRDGVMKAKGRSLEEQNAWENELSEKVISHKRTSRRWLPSQPWDMERLSKPLPTMEG